MTRPLAFDLWLLAFVLRHVSDVVDDSLSKGQRPKTKDQLRERTSYMPTYIALLKWTGQGISAIKDSPDRLDAGRKAFKKAGVKIKDTYLTMGRYDLLCVIDAPDDESYAAAILTLGSQGNVQTETLKAFSEADYRKIIGSI
jgi:uncharacterized protein with GYD domain